MIAIGTPCERMQARYPPLQGVPTAVMLMPCVSEQHKYDIPGGKTAQVNYPMDIYGVGIPTQDDCHPSVNCKCPSGM